MWNIFLVYIGTFGTIKDCLNAAAVVDNLPQFMTTVHPSSGGHLQKDNSVANQK